MAKVVGQFAVIFLVMAVLSPLCFAESKSKNRGVAQEVSVLVDDVVYKLEPSDNGYRVLFRTHAAVYYLKSNSKYYEQILRLLNTSKSSQEKIKLQVDATTMEIKEVAVQTK